MQAENPVILIPLTKAERMLQLSNVLLNVVIIAISLVSYNLLRDKKIPIRFSNDGVVDEWGAKEGLIVIPVILIGFGIMLTAIERFPHTYNYACKITEKNAPFQYLNARMMIEFLKIEFTISLAYIQLESIGMAFRVGTGIFSWFMPAFLIIVFGTAMFFVLRMIKNK